MKISKNEAKLIYINAISFLKENWPNYEASQGCLYEKEGFAYLVNETSIVKLLSKDHNLYGATYSSIDGVLTAIVDTNEICNKDEMTAVLIHELFHIHQLTKWEGISHPNPEYLITYPIKYENEYLRKKENMILVDILKSQKDMLDDFLQCREYRETYIENEYIEYENNIETYEGCAYYLENKFLKNLDESSELQNKRVSEMKLSNLNSMNYRRQYIAKGAFLTEVINIYIDDWKQNIENNGKTLIGLVKECYIPSKETHNIIIEEDGEIASMVSESVLTDEKLLESFMSKSNLFEICFDKEPNIYRVDPMNMRSISKNMIKHEKTLHVGNNEYYIKIDNLSVVTKFRDSIWKMRSIYLPLSFTASNYKKNGMLFYKSGKVEIKWMVRDVLPDIEKCSRIVLE